MRKIRFILNTIRNSLITTIIITIRYNMQHKMHKVIIEENKKKINYKLSNNEEQK